MRNRVQILYVIGSLGYGGTELHLLKLIKSLDKKYYEISLLVLAEEGQLKESFLKSKIKLILPLIKIKNKGNFIIKFLKLINLLYSFFFIYKFALKNKGAFIHFFLPASYIVGALAGIFAGHKKMIMSRRSLNNYQNYFFKFLEKKLHKKMYKIVGNSKKILAELTNEEGVSLEKLVLIYNGIKINNEKKIISFNKNKIFNFEKKNNVIMTIIANLIPYKGHMNLIKVCSLLTEKNWILLIVGEDRNNFSSKLLKFIKKKNLENQIKLLGLRDDINDILSISDIGVLASHEEGFSNAILEYMSFSLPVVATNVGGNPEAIIHEKNGFIVDPNNLIEFKNYLDLLIKDETKRNNFGYQSLIHLKSNFSFKRMIEGYNSLYLN